jgi:hypothetical protein
MKTIRRATAIASVIACAMIPIGIASASNPQAGPHGQAGQHGKAGEHGKAGQHGNHCGRNHVKHVKGQGGLKLGKSCPKAPHGQGADDSDDVAETD